MSVEIRRIGAADVVECEAILRSLPDWFGIEESNRQFVEDLGVLESWAAADGDRVVGFMALLRHEPGAVEIHVMAVRAEWQGQGIGRALVAQAEGRCRELGVGLLQVKTLGPSRESPHYERTRAFYMHLGFLLLEENQHWGADNPCLVMAKPVERQRPVLDLDLVPGVLAVARLAAGCEVPAWATAGALSSVTRTADETSVICAAEAVPAGTPSEGGYRALRVRGQLEFSLVGVLDALAGPLAQAGLSILAFSTFDTDYLLVRAGDLDRARAALVAAGHALRMH